MRPSIDGVVTLQYVIVLLSSFWTLYFARKETMAELSRKKRKPEVRNMLCKQEAIFDEIIKGHTICFSLNPELF